MGDWAMWGRGGAFGLRMVRFALRFSHSTKDLKSVAPSSRSSGAGFSSSSSRFTCSWTMMMVRPTESGS